MRQTDPVSDGNLPVELTGFVGRRRELGEVKRLLGASRLVTLTGVGGIGKTRLAGREKIERQLDDALKKLVEATGHDLVIDLRQTAPAVRPPRQPQPEPERSA